MMYAPVVVFVYARPIHTLNTLAALNLCSQADQTDLYIYSDCSRNERDADNVEKVRNIVDEFANNNNFRKVTIRKAENNKGLAKSVKEGVTEIINRYGTAIVVEDDLIVSKLFLEYMNCALEAYKDNNKVWSISGYSFEMDALNEYTHDVYVTGRGCSWGWSTWSDRWNRIDWDVKDFNSFRFNLKKRISFAKWGRDLPLMLDSQVLRGINSWAIIWCYQAFKEGMNTIYPKISMVQNTGVDGSGEHQSTEINKYSTHIDNRDSLEIVFDYPDVDKNIQREFADRYSSGWYIDLKGEIKDLLLRFGIKVGK